MLKFKSVVRSEQEETPLPWPRFNAAVGDQVQIVGDDLLVHCRDKFDVWDSLCCTVTQFRVNFAGFLQLAKMARIVVIYVILSTLSMFRVAWKDW